MTSIEALTAARQRYQDAVKVVEQARAERDEAIAAAAAGGLGPSAIAEAVGITRVAVYQRLNKRAGAPDRTAARVTPSEVPDEVLES